MSETPTSADAIVNILAAEGIEYVFGLPGSQILEVVDGIWERDDMEFVGTRHEQGAAFMAEGYARATRSPGVCLSTVGPGATNLVTGIASAYKGHVPVLALTGKHARWQQERNTFQEIDQKELFEPVTRYSRMAAEPGDLPKMTRKAFRLMETNPRGPAHLNLPKDTQTERLEDTTQPRHSYHPERPNRPSDVAVQSVVNALEEADHPVFLAGYDVVWEDVVDDLVKLAESITAPVVTSGFHLDAFPTVHDLGMGPIGPGFWESANDVMSDADLVVAVGAHFDFLSTNFDNGVIPPEADKIQIHSDPENIGAVYPLKVGISGSSEAFLTEALEQVDGVKTMWDIADLVARKESWRERREEDVNRDAEPPNPATVVHLVREAAPDDTRFVVDGGNFQKHVIRQLDTYKSNTYISNANFGTVGSAFPMSLGVAMGVDEPVICLTGDGGMGLNIQELETAARRNLPVISIVFNDYGMSNVRSYQKYVYDEHYTGVDFADQNFATIAEGFGIDGRHISNPDAINDAIQEGLQHPRPFVIDVDIDIESALERPVFMDDE